jgi:hypothetical protein
MMCSKDIIMPVLVSSTTGTRYVSRGIVAWWSTIEMQSPRLEIFEKIISTQASGFDHEPDHKYRPLKESLFK